MDGDQICKEIANIHENILGAGIIEKGLPLALHVRPDMPMPRQDRFEVMLGQTEIIMSIFETNEDYFGKFHYLMAHNDSSDLFFFPVAINGRRMVLVIRVLGPYSHEEVVGKVRQYVGKLRIAR